MCLLSKSKILAYRQCPRRLWLEIHRPELREDAAGTLASFQAGHSVGEVARQIYDPDGKGNLIDVGSEGYDGAFARTQALLGKNTPIFEAGFSANGALAFADVMLPLRKGRSRVWRMVEVKSSTSVKEYHRDDVAVQAWIATSAGVPLVSIAVAHIDNSWTYPGGGDYTGLLVEEDLSAEALGRAAEAQSWVTDAQTIARKRKEPGIPTGSQCGIPYECGFQAHCRKHEPQAKYPVSWFPRIQSRTLKAHIEEHRVVDMREVPDALLSAQQLRVKQHSLSGTTYFDVHGAAADLAPHKLPGYFLDFETIMFPVPIWKGTRPYQQIPFQFSLHRLSRTGKLEHQSFLDLSGKDPSRAFTQALVAACGEQGPVFVYNAGFETARIRELAERFPRDRRALLAINERVVDLLPIARERYYHPSQEGSWSIKSVLPAIAPELRYDALDGVQGGGMAMEAYLEAINTGTNSTRKEQLREQLLDYCGLDTLALVRLWQFFSQNSRKNRGKKI